MRSDEEIEADARDYAEFRRSPLSFPVEHEEVFKAYLRGYADCRRKEQATEDGGPVEIETTGKPWDVEGIERALRSRLDARYVRRLGWPGPW